MNETMERLYRFALEEHGIQGQTALAKALNTSPQTINNWEARGISKEGKLKAHAVLGVDPFWLDTGKLLLRKRPPTDLADEGLGEISAWDSDTPLEKDEIEVPFYKEEKLSAGSGSIGYFFVTPERRSLRFAASSLRKQGVDPRNAVCATIHGNSMERMIMDGATIGIDRGRTQIKDGRIYAIEHEGMMRVKYLYNMPGGGIRLKSENSEEHPDEIYSRDQANAIVIVGWVFWWSQMSTW